MQLFQSFEQGYQQTHTVPLNLKELMKKSGRMSVELGKIHSRSPIRIMPHTAHSKKESSARCRTS